MIFDAGFLHCPYCNCSFEIEVDPTEASTQELIIDCEICCRPIEVQVKWDTEGELQLSSFRDESVS